MTTVPSPLDVPSYRHHKARNCAVVTLSGHNFYLGPWESPESKTEYQRLVGEWLARGRVLPPQDTSVALSVNELMLAYLRFAEGYYRDAEGQSTRELETLRLVFRPLRELYGHTAAVAFGPKALQCVRQKMIEAGLSRRTINQRVGYLKRLFAWGCAEELLPGSVHHGLLAVTGLRRGRSGARETDPVLPVPDAHVQVVLDYLPPLIQTMLSLQRLTGMRNGELIRMRVSDIDMSGRVWRYQPQQHKTRYLGHERLIALGPKCQELLRPLLTLCPSDYLFSPQQAATERAAMKRILRKTKVQPSQQHRRKVKPAKQPGIVYTSRSYYRALRYAMAAAERDGKLARAHFWHPHQLRHNAAQRIAREQGLEAARAFLGHSQVNMTAHYSGLDLGLASEVASRMA